jgi:hypothetical protein
VSSIHWGNGLTAGGTAADSLRIYDSEGFDAPEIELAVIESTRFDGSVVGGSRSKGRRLTVWMDTDDYTRDEILRAFTPGVLRYLSTSKGSMPYYVEIAPQFKTANTTRQVDFSVVLFSPLAFLEGQELTETNQEFTGTTIEVTTGTPTSVPAYSATRESIYQTFQVASTCTASSLRFSGLEVTEPGISVSLTLCSTTGQLPDISTGVITFRQFLAFTSDTSLSASIPSGLTLSPGLYALVLDYPAGKVIPRCDNAAPYGNGAGGYRASGGFTPGDGAGDITVDWAFRFTSYTDTSQPTTALMASDIEPYLQTDVETDLALSIKMTAAASSLAISDGVRLMTLTGAFADGDIVEVDGSQNTVTVNGVNRLSWFDRAGDFPKAGSQLALGYDLYVTFSEPVIATARWKPRRMGLL